MPRSVTIYSLTAPDGRTWIADPPRRYTPCWTNLGWEADLSDDVDLLAYAPSIAGLPAVLGRQLALRWDAVCGVEAWWDLAEQQQRTLLTLTSAFILVQPRRRRPVARPLPAIGCPDGCRGGNGCAHSQERPYRRCTSR